VICAAWAAAAPVDAQTTTPFDPPPYPENGAAPRATFIAPSQLAAEPSPAEGAITPTPLSAGSVPADAKPIEGSQIVARIEDQTILASDVMWQGTQMIAMLEKQKGQKVPPSQLPEIHQQLMRRNVMQLVDTKLLFAAFRRSVPAEALPKIEEQLAEPFEKIQIPRLTEMFGVKTRAELEAALQGDGASLKVVQRQFMEKEVAGEFLRQRAGKPKPITHDEMLAYYQDHLKEYEYPAQVKWEELMARFDKFEGDDNARRAAAWKALAEMGNEVWKQAAANPGMRGPVFAEVAKAKSHGFTAADGGMQAWTTLGALKCEDLNQALATLELGQMSDGIESEQGFHIVRVLERKAAGRTSFMEAQAKIREILEAEQRASLVQAEVEKVRKTARVWTIWDGDLAGERLSQALGNKMKR
jgi:hypothetical protein